VRERQRIAALDAEVDALQRQALALGAVRVSRHRCLTALVDQCPNSAEGDIRALNEGSGLTHIGHLSAYN
jgi:hypothetical protein